MYRFELLKVVKERGCLFLCSFIFWFVQISKSKMKAEFAKLLKLYEELEEAGENATLTFTSQGGSSTIKLLL